MYRLVRATTWIKNLCRGAQEGHELQGFVYWPLVLAKDIEEWTLWRPNFRSGPLCDAL